MLFVDTMEYQITRELSIQEKGLLREQQPRVVCQKLIHVMEIILSKAVRVRKIPNHMFSHVDTTVQKMHEQNLVIPEWVSYVTNELNRNALLYVKVNALIVVKYNVTLMELKDSDLNGGTKSIVPNIC